MEAPLIKLLYAQLKDLDGVYKKNQCWRMEGNV